MGSINSKSNDTAAFIQKNNLEDIGGNPDPRSPTPEITRTPLQDKQGPKHNITKNADLRKALENGNGEGRHIHNNPILSAVIKSHFQSFDPRSPTQEFERTPIAINTKVIDSSGDKTLCAKSDSPNLHHNNSIISPSSEIVPKNLCNGFYDLSLNESLKDEEPLGSSTASNEAIEDNLPTESSKPTELLETNFDYVDHITENIENKQSDDLQKNDTLFSMLNPGVKNIPAFKILNDDPRSPSIGIDRTPIVVQPLIRYDEQPSDENVEDISDESLIKVFERAPSDTDNKSANKSSDGIHIYEDKLDNLKATPRTSKSDSNNGSRTPLSCMKNKTEGVHVRSKSAHTMPEKNKNSQPKRISRIPRLKSLQKSKICIPMGSSISLKNTMNGDCENTPPHSHRDKWDKESSIVL